MICLAIVQRFGGGFPFFSVFYVCFYKKMCGSSGFSGGGAQRENTGGTGWKNGWDCLCIPLKMSKFISNFNHGAIWITCN